MLFKKIKTKLQNKDNSIMLSNFFSLSVLQVMTYIFPLITFPYLVRVLGIEIFGLLAMATALVAYLHIITDYGFDLSATKEISVHRDNSEKVSEIFSSVMIIKVLFMIVSLILLSIVVFSFNKFSQYWEVYFLSYGLIIGQALFPIWFFQGMEKMRYITIIMVISKTVFTISIFVFVHTKEDFLMVPLLYAIGAIVSGIVSLYIIRRDFNVKFYFQPLRVLFIYLQDGWNIFMQRLYVNLHNNMANTLILGLLTNDTIVGIFSIATRIIGIIGELFKIASRVYYPYFSKKFSINPKQSFINLKKIVKLIFLLSTVTMIVLFFSNEFLLKLITGERFDILMVDVLMILTIGVIMLPFFTLFTNVLVAVNKSKELKEIARWVAVLNLIFAAPIVYFYGVIGLAYWSVVLQFIILYQYLVIVINVGKKILHSVE